MIDIEILTTVLKELGYLDDSEEREEHPTGKPASETGQKEDDTKE